MKSSTLRLIAYGMLIAVLIMACLSITPASQSPMPTAQLAVQTNLENHTPVILQVEERTGIQNGWLTINKDISFTDPQGDAVIVVHRLISTDPAGLYISRWDDVAVTASADEQKFNGMVTSPAGCPMVLYPFSVTVEARIRDAVGNLSEPVALVFACPKNSPNSIPSLLIALAIGIGLLAGFWLHFRRHPADGKPAILSTLLLFCSLFAVYFMGSILHEGGHALASLFLGIPIWNFYVHPFSFSGFVRPFTDNVWFHALGHITNLLASSVIFCLFWRRRSAAKLPLVLLFPFEAISQGILILTLNGDIDNILRLTGLPAIIFIPFGLVLVCSGLILLLALFPLLGLDPADKKSLLVLPAAFSLHSFVGWLVAHLFVPGSTFNFQYLDVGTGIIESANTLAILLPIVSGLFAAIYVTLFRKTHSRLPVWLRTETVTLTWRDLRVPAMLAVISVILGFIIITL